MSHRLRILIVDDDPRMTKTLSDILKVNGYDAECARSGFEALDKINAVCNKADRQFHCVLTDIMMPGIKGPDLFTAIKKIEPELPVVFMTAYYKEEHVNKALIEGVMAVLQKPLNINLLLNFLSVMSKKLSIVIVDDDPQFCKTLGDILRKREYPITQVSVPSTLMEKLKPEGQLVLLDMKLNGTNGLEVLKKIRKKYLYLPVILVTGYQNEMSSMIDAAMKLNAFTYFYKPIEIESLLKAIADVHNRQLKCILEQSNRI